MNNKTTYTAALIALGLVSAASAQTRIQITGSTAFRANFFSAATAASGGIFDAGTAAAALPAGATSGSSAVVFSGNINHVPYVFSCSWSGSEAGIANVAGKSSLQNPGYPASLPGVSTVFLQNNGSAGTSATIADLALADTSQAVSLTPKSVVALHDFGTLGVVTFTWVKSKNTAPDSSWTDLTTVSEYQMATALGSTVNASFLTGGSADTDSVFIVGRNAGSGTRANTLCDLNEIPTAVSVSQAAFNSYYTGAGVLTFNIVKTGLPGGGASTPAQDAIDQAASYPSIQTCLANSVQQSTATQSTVPNVVGVGNDGYDSGGFVSDCLSLDGANVPVVVVGYAGISDAKNAKNGTAFSVNETSPSQPGGAVWLNLDGVPYSDAAVVQGNYPFWGHEHLYGQTTPSTSAVTAAQAIFTAFNTVGNEATLGLGNGSTIAGPSSGISGTVMAVDKPGGGDTGYPAPITVGNWGEAFNP